MAGRGRGRAGEVPPQNICPSKNALKARRERITDRMESIAHISLPLLVETDIVRITPLGWRDNTLRVIYVNMKPYEESNAVHENSRDVDIFLIFELQLATISVQKNANNQISHALLAVVRWLFDALYTISFHFVQVPVMHLVLWKSSHENYRVNQFI